MYKALLDTDIFSEGLKGINSAVTARAAAYHAAFGRGVHCLKGPKRDEITENVMVDALHASGCKPQGVKARLG